MGVSTYGLSQALRYHLELNELSWTMLCELVSVQKCKLTEEMGMHWNECMIFSEANVDAKALFFSPFRDKYGHESDSDSDDKSSMSSWISPTPYQTKGKVSEWKIRSPAKSQTASQRGKVAVARGGSPKKKGGAGRKTNAQAGQKNTWVMVLVFMSFLSLSSSPLSLKNMKVNKVGTQNVCWMEH